MSLRPCRRRLSMEGLEARHMLAAFDVLVFSKTAGFRHNAIPDGIAAIQSLGGAHDFSVTATEDASAFNSANLVDYEAVVFLNTTGNVLDAAQQLALEQYIQNGGGWVGIHAAADTEYDWDWYGDLVGAYFKSHPATQPATIVVADQVHPSTASLPQLWTRTDEWYDFRTNPRGNVHVLATVDEGTYTGGTMGFDHPIAWYHDFDGGRAWYTGLGHTRASYTEPLFLSHLLGGIQYAAGQIPADGGATIDANFAQEVLETEVTNPMELEVAPDGRVFFIERGGALRIHDPATRTTTTAGQLAVYTRQEDGLLGLALDPDFGENSWLYLFYSPAGPTAQQHVSRFTLVGDQLDLSSEQVLLAIPTQRSQCCHAAGSLQFGPGGELFIATGDDTNPFASDGFAPIDERTGRSAWDAQRTSANTADLRGKILRIKPTSDGTYSIPEGNLFPSDGSAGRPEIYVMGNRNPFRISVDPLTGWLYWGDVGPDATQDLSARGSRGYDEINQAKAAGNFGWPYFVGDNQAYRDYNFETATSGELFDALAPWNESPNNSGATGLPPAEPAWIWYPYARSDQFPELGTGNRTAAAGPVYHFDPLLQSSTKLPEYFDNTLLIYDWARRWVKEVKLNDAGEVVQINPFAPQIELTRPIDIEIGPDGAVYVLEWGSTFGGNNPDAQLSRINFLGRPRIVSADFDEDRNIDGGDFLAWQRGFGLPGGARRSDGDADVDGTVDGSDLALWAQHFGTVEASAAATQLAAPSAEGTFSAAAPQPNAVFPGTPSEAALAGVADRLAKTLTSGNRSWRPAERDAAFFRLGVENMEDWASGRASGRAGGRASSF
jgi:cytochrome c